jgi:hypothetical protein
MGAQVFAASAVTFSAVEDPPTENARESYRPEFDGLRAISVTLVWVSHLYAAMFKNGVIGVDIFFVLSGYLITGVLAQEYAKNGRLNLVNFYMRRFLRLVPALWLLLAASVVWYAAEQLVRPGLLGSVFASGTYIMNFNRIFRWMGEGFLGHTWSLAVEEQFYLVWPLALILIPRAYWLRTAVFAAILVMLWRFYLALEGADVGRIYNGPDCRMDTILVGCACALLIPATRERLKPFLRFRAAGGCDRPRRPFPGAGDGSALGDVLVDRCGEPALVGPHPRAGCPDRRADPDDPAARPAGPMLVWHLSVALSAFGGAGILWMDRCLDPPRYPADVGYRRRLLRMAGAADFAAQVEILQQRRASGCGLIRPRRCGSGNAPVHRAACLSC